MNSDQKTALPGSLDFSHQIYIITSPLNWHNTFKNSFQWHSGRCCQCPVHMALGISLHTDSFANSHSSLSEALIPEVLCLGISAGNSCQSMVNEYPSLLLPLFRIVDCPEFQSGIKPISANWLDNTSFIGCFFCFTFPLSNWYSWGPFLNKRI